MPSYRTHVSVNLALGLPLSLAALKYTVHTTPFDTASFAAAFVYGTLFLHPDLDLARKIKLFSLKGLLTLPFRSYSYVFRHRGVSHIPIIGTITRIAWLIGCLYLLCIALEWAFPHHLLFDPEIVAYAAIGIALADLIHILLDQLF